MATHAYWRLQNLNSVAGFIAIAEGYLRLTVGGSNVAPLAATAYGSFDPAYFPSKAVDGNIATFWNSSTGGGAGKWFAWQFTTPIEPAQVTITARNDFGGGGDQAPYQFDLEYSDDGATWTLYQSGCTITPAFGPGDTRTFAFTPPVSDPDINAEQARVLAPIERSPPFRVPIARVLAPYNIPTDFIHSQQARLMAAVGKAIETHVQQARILAVVRGRVASPYIAAWTFTLDGHDYYVIQLQDETLLYDFHAERWYQWGSFNYSYWTTDIGMDWNANLGTIMLGLGVTIAQGQKISNVLCGDALGNLYFLAPEQTEDEINGTDTRPFQRVVTGQVVQRGHEYVEMPAVQLSGSDGEFVIATNMDVTLLISDDAGHTYEDCGAVTVEIGDYNPQLEWRSLGSFTAPGRLVRVVDWGALVRIDDLSIPQDEDG